MSNKPISEIVAENPTLGRVLLHKKYPQYTVHQYNKARIKFLKESLVEESDLDNAYKLSKSRQNFMDKNRFLNKVIRDQSRVDSSYDELIKEIEKLSERPVTRYKPKPPSPLKPNTGEVGIIHLTDWHLGETVNIKGVNVYDFKTASQRLYKLYEKSTSYLRDCKEVYVLMTGDMVNSDRRIGEITGNEFSRAETAIRASIMIEDFLTLLSTRFNIRVAAVAGNESRININHGHEDFLMKDNYDFIIYKTLAAMLKREESIIFEDIDYFGEHVVNVNGSNILMIHGDTIRGNVDVSIQNIVGKYSRRGVLVDYVIYGHLHSAMISDFYARGGSLVGSNDYSDVTLNFSSKASQNLHIVYPGGDIDSIKIDLSTKSEKGFEY